MRQINCVINWFYWWSSEGQQLARSVGFQRKGWRWDQLHLVPWQGQDSSFSVSRVRMHCRGCWCVRVCLYARDNKCVGNMEAYLYGAIADDYRTSFPLLRPNTCKQIRRIHPAHPWQPYKPLNRHSTNRIMKDEPPGLSSFKHWLDARRTWKHECHWRF